MNSHVQKLLEKNHLMPSRKARTSRGHELRRLKTRVSRIDLLFFLSFFSVNCGPVAPYRADYFAVTFFILSVLNTMWTSLNCLLLATFGLLACVVATLAEFRIKVATMATTMHVATVATLTTASKMASMEFGLRHGGLGYTVIVNFVSDSGTPLVSYLLSNPSFYEGTLYEVYQLLYGLKSSLAIYAELICSLCAFNSGCHIVCSISLFWVCIYCTVYIYWRVTAWKTTFAWIWLHLFLVHVPTFSGYDARLLNCYCWNCVGL